MLLRGDGKLPSERGKGRNKVPSDGDREGQGPSLYETSGGLSQGNEYIPPYSKMFSYRTTKIKQLRDHVASMNCSDVLSARVTSSLSVPTADESKLHSSRRTFDTQRSLSAQRYGPRPADARTGISEGGESGAASTRNRSRSVDSRLTKLRHRHMRVEAEGKMAVAFNRAMRETADRLTAATIPWVPTSTNSAMCNNSVDLFVTRRNSAGGEHPLMIRSPMEKRSAVGIMGQIPVLECQNTLSGGQIPDDSIRFVGPTRPTRREDTHSAEGRAELLARVVQYRAIRRAPWSGRRGTSGERDVSRERDGRSETDTSVGSGINSSRYRTPRDHHTSTRQGQGQGQGGGLGQCKGVSGNNLFGAEKQWDTSRDSRRSGQSRYPASRLLATHTVQQQHLHQRSDSGIDSERYRDEGDRNRELEMSCESKWTEVEDRDSEETEGRGDRGEIDLYEDDDSGTGEEYSDDEDEDEDEDEGDDVGAFGGERQREGSAGRTGGNEYREGGESGRDNGREDGRGDGREDSPRVRYGSLGSPGRFSDGGLSQGGMSLGGVSQGGVSLGGGSFGGHSTGGISLGGMSLGQSQANSSCSSSSGHSKHRRHYVLTVKILRRCCSQSEKGGRGGKAGGGGVEGGRVVEEVGILIVRSGATKRKILTSLLNQFPVASSSLSSSLKRGEGGGGGRGLKGVNDEERVPVAVVTISQPQLRRKLSWREGAEDTSNSTSNNTLPSTAISLAQEAMDFVPFINDTSEITVSFL